MKLHLGQQDNSGRGVYLDLDALVRTRMLLQASSGGGKSWTLRRLLEQSHGHVQQLVFDPEGEFATLREKYDYVLVGKGGDVATDPRSAPLLMRRLMELGTSAIIDLFEMTPSERRHYVHVAFGALVDLPKPLWHPCIVVLDEAQDFAPEKGKGESEALEAVIGVTGRGRKRGLCAVLATPRISKLNKDATASLRNRLVGLAVEDVDRKRAADEIGIADKSDILALRDLEAGDFFALGPALRVGHPAQPVRERLKVHIGPVETSHPVIGRRAATAPPPREQVKAVLSKLADLPKEAEEEAQTVGALKAEVRRLRHELSGQLKAKASIVSEALSTKPPKVVKVPFLSDRQAAKLLKAENQFREAAARLSDNAANWARLAKDLADAIVGAKGREAWESAVHMHRRETLPHSPAGVGTRNPPAAGSRLLEPSEPHHANFGHTVRVAEGARLGVGEKKILAAVAQYPEGVTREQLTVLTGYRRSSRDTYLQRLRAAGWVHIGARVFATPEGIAALGNDYEPLPSGQALRDHWLRELPAGERKILEVLLRVYPNEMDREMLSEETGYQRSSRDTYLQRLRARELVVANGRGPVKASAGLFE